MKKSYEHLNSNVYKRNDYSDTLLYKSTSKYFWVNNNIITTFILYLQAIIMTGARRIKYISNYQNPINKSIE